MSDVSGPERRLQYTEAVQDHFFRPRNVGPLEGATHQGAAGVPGNGPYVVIWLKMERGRVREAAYSTFGCPACVAAASAAAEMVIGKSEEAAGRLTARGILRRLGGLPEGKEHCPALAVQAVKNALQ